MGQAASSSSSSSSSSSAREKPPLLPQPESRDSGAGAGDGGKDYTAALPDECLALVMGRLVAPADRKACAEVCRRWYRVEGWSRQRLTLDAAAADTEAAVAAAPKMLMLMFRRFENVTRLVLRCGRGVPSIGDDAAGRLAEHLPASLRKLKMKGCRALTDEGAERLALACPNLQKLSIVSCAFGVRGMNAFLLHCGDALEELSVKHLKGLLDASPLDVIGGAAAPGARRLRRVSLKEVYGAHMFVPLIAGSKGLHSLKLFRCSGDWDRLLELLSDHVSGLVEIHLERLQVSDKGLAAVSRWTNLEVLHLVKAPECTNAGLIAIANSCKKLRKLHIDGWKTNRIGDEGLMAIGRKCLNLQELVLMGLNPSVASLSVLSSNCQALERLALCASDTVGDAEISCIAAKCLSLKKLCIKSCPVLSNQGIKALVSGCPKLVKVKVKKCRGVTVEGAEWLKANRGSLAVNLDSTTSPPTSMPPDVSVNIQSMDLHAPSSSRNTAPKAKFSFFAGRSLVACAFMRVSTVSS